MKKPSNKQHFLDFIVACTTTNSPAIRLNAFHRLMLEEPGLLDSETTLACVDLLEAATAKKSAAGRNDIAKRWTKVKAAKDNTLNGWAAMSSRYASRCERCQRPYLVGDVVLLNNKKGYHPDCAPKEALDNEKVRSFYERLVERANAK